MGITTNEFPLLHDVGLYVKDIDGNGNCLFNALSDQMYGDQTKHGELRSGVIKYMRENAAYYKQFIEVHPGGGVRRNPKRKNAGSFSTPFNNTAPTAEEIDRKFENHLLQMARGGTWGDNMEISAFSEAFNVDVKIYQRDFCYVVSTKPEGTVVPMVHIAYHVWEHYSSIRNIEGPHTGLPFVKQAHLSAEDAKEENKKLANAPYVLPWMVNVVMQSLPYLADRQAIQKMIEECKGNIDAAVSKLLDAEEQSSASSRQGSLSVERDADSDDEEPIRGPKKRQDRRMSRATRTLTQEKEERCTEDLSFRLKVDHLPTTIEHSLPLNANHLNGVKLQYTDEIEEEDWRNNSPYKDSESASVSTSASDYSTASKPRSGGVRLKLTQPKKCNTPSSSQGDYLHVPGKPANRANGKVQQLPLGQAKRRHLTRRDLKDQKKTAQKAASKERKQGAAARRANNGQNPTVPLTVKEGKENAPAIEAHIKVLYI